MRPTKYHWPASRLSNAALIHDLHVISKKQRVPLTRLIEAAVREHVARERDAMDDPVSPTNAVSSVA